MNMKYVVDFMMEILNIPSPAGDTREGMERVRKEFESMGITTKSTNKGALIATMQGENDDNQKIISAHIDTLGAVVKEIKESGRLKLSNIGGIAWGSLEGENVIIRTIKGDSYAGTVLPIKASVHVHGDDVREMKRTLDNMEVRIDEDVNSKEDVIKLGIRVGDFVYFEPKPVVTNSGYIKSKHLDDKAAVAIVFGVIQHLKQNNLKPKNTVHFFISNYEEVCHGVTSIPVKTTEHLAIDIGTVGEGQTSDEHSVSICAKDAWTPYDFEFKKKLVTIAEKNDINYNVDVYVNYGSDASLGARQGCDVNFACIGPGVDATHHYERTHIDAIENTIKLIVKYIQ